MRRVILRSSQGGRGGGGWVRVGWVGRGGGGMGMGVGVGVVKVNPEPKPERVVSRTRKPHSYMYT